MNIEKEKKKYIAPFMEILDMEAKSSLLSASGYDDGVDVDVEGDNDGYDDEFN